MELAEEIFEQSASAEAAQPIQTNREENITYPASVTGAFFWQVSDIVKNEHAKLSTIK